MTSFVQHSLVFFSRSGNNSNHLEETLNLHKQINSMEQSCLYEANSPTVGQ
jgi:hypothetical protein